MSEFNIYELLSDIQQRLKAPKGQTNNFGNYKYRSCEDIVEAVKPLLLDTGASLIMTDDMIGIEGRVYVKATVTIHCQGQSVSASALAREALAKKGMDDSQITGTASSYARKYALNGLFAIDDTKDADTQDNSGITGEPIDEQKVEKAYAYFVSQIDDEEQDDTVTADNIKKAWPRLHSDEQILLNNKLKAVKHGKKQYNTILREYLNYGETNEL